LKQFPKKTLNNKLFLWYNKKMHFKKILKNRLIVGVGIGLIISLLCLILNSFGIFRGLHLRFADTLYTRNAPSEEIIIIAIDNPSTAHDTLGRFTRWSRENYTNLLSVLSKENPSVIGFDILFAAPTEHIFMSEIGNLLRSFNPETSNREKLEKYEEFAKENSDPLSNKIDQNFHLKLKEFDNIVLAFDGNTKGEIHPYKLFSINAILGNHNATPDKDGVARRSNISRHDDFAVAIAKTHFQKEDLTLPTNQEDNLMINYFGDPYSFTMIPFISVLNENFEKGTFDNKIVLIGLTTFREIDDTNLTPKSNQIPMPGVEIWANEIQTIIEQKFLREQSYIGQFLTVLGVTTILVVALNFSGIVLSIFITLLAILLYLASAHFFYYQGVILNMVYPFLAIVSGYLASWVYKYFIADKEKKEITSAFSHYVSDELVKEIAKNPESVKLGGEKLPVTVFFSDIENSTTLSEKTDIKLWVNQINEYFTEMEKIIKANGGTLDKYEGDAIMTFWNAPIRQENHASRAFTTAILSRKKLIELNQKWQTENKPELKIRIGIYSGEAIVGNFGSENRFDYTVMGNTPNTASRLESSINKIYGTRITVAGFEKYTSSTNLQNFVLRELDTVILPGKTEPIKIFELVGFSQNMPEKIKQTITTYQQGMISYFNKNWQEAIKLFESIPEDLPAQTMLKRCKLLQKNTPIPELTENMEFKISTK
jgi:class 3 adenylate cyclase/CHASE2 domain-containing sensor protein